MAKLSVSELTIYPLKSAKGVTLDSMALSELGPECDRRWMVIDKNNNFVTQRKTPAMCLIRTELVDGELYISAEESGRCHVPPGGVDIYQSSVWGTSVNGSDCGSKAAQWISDFLDQECRIIYMHETDSRLVDPNFANNNEHVGFADGFPLLITSQASLDDFNSKLSALDSGDSKTGLRIGMERFRPNIVVTGNPAWAEDSWKRLTINDVEFSLVKPCSRCIMPSVNPATAKKQMQVNQTLLTHRRRGRQTYFGQNALYDRFGTINIGDAVTVIDPR